MPELPEVETVMRGLAPVMAGRRLMRVEQRRADLRFPFPADFVQRLEGRRVEGLRRRAKYILADIEGGAVLLMHLGMSGRFTISAPGGAGGRQLGEFTYEVGGDESHDHVVFHIEGGATVTYNDARRFGAMDVFPAADADEHPLLGGLGIEPLGPDLTSAFIEREARGRRSDLKAFLLDQRIIAGLGNIYVCEVLYRTELSPFASAGRLAGRAMAPVREKLVAEIRAVLGEAIEAGGSTLRDYKQADGALGYFQHSFRIYGREGDPCATPGCGSSVRRKVQGGRSTFYCPTCQRGTRPTPRAVSGEAASVTPAAGRR